MFRKFACSSALVLIMAVIVSVILIFVGIVILVLLHVYFSERLSRRRAVRGSMVERGGNGGRRMSINDLEKLPCYDYVAKDNASSPVDCAVCLENLITGDKCRLLPMCKHSFHAQCVDTWLLKTPICPICRSNADSLGGDQVIGNSDNCIEPNSGSRENLNSTTGIELDDNMLQLRETLESAPSRNIDTELIENPTLESLNNGDGGIESREHQTDTIENQISATTLLRAVEIAAL